MKDLKEAPDDDRPRGQYHAAKVQTVLDRDAALISRLRQERDEFERNWHTAIAMARFHSDRADKAEARVKELGEALNESDAATQRARVRSYKAEGCAAMIGTKDGDGYEEMVAGRGGWSEWVHPMPGYKMACCDCGLVHDLQFRLDDLNQLNFRARRNNRETRKVRGKAA